MKMAATYMRELLKTKHIFYLCQLCHESNTKYTHNIVSIDNLEIVYSILRNSSVRNK